MRIPTSDIYRAFPELDRFSDDRCRQFVAWAQRNRRWSRAASRLGAALAAVATWFVVAWLWVAALAVATPTGPAAEWLIIVVISTTVMSGALVALLIRDRWLRWAISEQIDAARCPACRYSLLGLAAADGIITCPECGEGRAIEELALSPDEARLLAAGQPVQDRAAAGLSSGGG